MKNRRGSLALLAGCLLISTTQATDGPTEAEVMRHDILQESPRPSSSTAPSFSLPPSSNSSQGEDPQRHWRRVKGIFSNMESILKKLYEGEIRSGHVPLHLIPRMMLVGDAVYGAKTIYKRLDPGLVDLVREKLRSGFLRRFKEPLGEILTLPDVQEIVDDLVTRFVVETGHFLHHQAMTFAHELEFVTELMLSSGFEKEEISVVLKLLGLPPLPRETERSFGEPPVDDAPVEAAVDGSRRRPRDGRFSPNRRNSEYDYPAGGYGYQGGYSGGYGGYGGYMQDMSKIDPFVILGGLAFLTLCSYVTFLVLSSKTRKRSVPDLSLDLSDLPNLNLIFEAMDEESFGASKQGTEDLLAVIPHEVNLMWRNYKQDPSTGSCMQQFLCESLFRRTQRHLLSSNEFLLQIIRSAVAQTLGDSEAPRRADEGITQLLDEEPRARDSCSEPRRVCSKEETKGVS